MRWVIIEDIQMARWLMYPEVEYSAVLLIKCLMWNNLPKDGVLERQSSD